MKHQTAVTLAAILAMPAIAGAQSGRPAPTPDLVVYVERGSAVCATVQELEAFEQGAPARCTRAAADVPVVILESRGWLVQSHRVRMVGTRRVAEGWVSAMSFKSPN
jgi:hypothetical protein